MHVANVPEQEGVFELADSSRSTIYFGRSDDLKGRLQQFLDTTDPCFRRAAHFRYELTARSEQRKRELLKEYYERHDRYPLCS
jgi:excinuclease UvrABC nuclease subunit